MDKLLGRGPGWVFLRKDDDTHPRWYRVEVVDLLGQFDSESDDVVRCTYETNWSGAEASSQSFVLDYF